MSDNTLFKTIQDDLKNSKTTIKMIRPEDNESTIIKSGIDYVNEISDSEADELASYKSRNLKTIRQLRSNGGKKKKSIEQIAQDVQNNEKCKDELNGTNSAPSAKKVQETDGKIEYEYSAEFVEKVKQYVKNDDRIRELQNELKALNSAKKAAENEVLKHLERLGETGIDITGGKLRKNQYESKEGLKEDLIKEALGEKISDPKIVEAILEKINEKRVAGAKVQISLKRTFERGKKADAK